MQVLRLFLRIANHRLRRAALIAAATVVSALPVHALMCEARSPERFEAFIERFSTDRVFSLARTRMPLPTLRWIYGDDVPTQQRGAAARFELEKQPTLAAYRQANGLSSEIDRTQAGHVRYRMFKPDSDWLMVYHFRLIGNCWRLERFEDQSL